MVWVLWGKIKTVVKQTKLEKCQRDTVTDGSNRIRTTKTKFGIRWIVMILKDY